MQSIAGRNAPLHPTPGRSTGRPVADEPLTGRGTRAGGWAATAVLAQALFLSAPGALSAQIAPQAGDPGAPPSLIERALESRTKGGENATVVVFEIADFQCPYCAQFSETVGPEVDEKYVATGDVQWVFVNLPLHSHPLAFRAAEAALCAGATGDQFWPMHDRLFAEQETWGSAGDPGALFARYAADLGVPAGAFSACTAEDQVASLILQDLGSAVSAGINGTPTFIIMKDQQVVERLVGLQPVEEWARVLDSALGR